MEPHPDIFSAIEQLRSIAESLTKDGLPRVMVSYRVEDERVFFHLRDLPADRQERIKSMSIERIRVDAVMGFSTRMMKLRLKEHIECYKNAPGNSDQPPLRIRLETH